MSIKKPETEVLETTEAPGIATPRAGSMSDSILGISVSDRRRQNLFDNCVTAILSGLKLDLDKMPSQEGRNKIINFAKKMADDAIAANN